MIGREARAVVSDSQMDILSSRPQADGHVAGARVAGDGGERPLDDAKQVGLCLVGKTAGELGAVFHVDVGPFAKAFGQPTQARIESKVVEYGGAQQLR